MNRKIGALIIRDIRKALTVRAYLIWLALSGMGIFFFYATGAKTMLIENNQIQFSSLFLPHMILGSWAVLSTYFDLISADRESCVLDCITSSGVSKREVYLSKVVATMLVSILLALVYLLPVTVVIISLSGDFQHILLLLQYVLPLWGYIMVYAALGMLLSVLARSSKNALITSLAVGVILMPRFFVMIIDGIGKLFGWNDQMVEKLSLLAPGVMMQALSDLTDTSRCLQAAGVFGYSTLGFFILGGFIFSRQQEYNYGER